MISRIESAQNERLKHFSKLYRRKYREKTGQYVIEGVHLIQEALKNGAEPATAFIREGFGQRGEEETLIRKLEACGTELFAVPSGLFDRIVNTETPQGIAAVSDQSQCGTESFFCTGNGSNILVLDRLQDPGNLGTIIRTADASGFRRILLMKGTADVFAPKTVRAAAGSLYRVRFAYLDQPEDALNLLRERGYRTVCTSPRADRVYFDEDLASCTALIIGNEAQGACDAFLGGADCRVSIPMEGSVESLNASVAASILMYESVRQRAQSAK